MYLTPEHSVDTPPHIEWCEPGKGSERKTSQRMPEEWVTQKVSTSGDLEHEPIVSNLK